MTRAAEATRASWMIRVITAGIAAVAACAALLAGPEVPAHASSPARLISAVWTGTCQLTVSGAGIDSGSGRVEIYNGGLVIGRSTWGGVGSSGTFAGRVTTNQCRTGAVYSYQVYDGGQTEQGWNALPLPSYSISQIATEWLLQGGPSGWLGYPTAFVTTTSTGDGQYLPFNRGWIYHSILSGAHVVYGYIGSDWQSLGATASILGYPISDEASSTVAGGRYEQFQGGTVLWLPGWTHAYAVQGSIKAEWAALGHEAGFLGYPVTNELTTPDGYGRFNHFQGGSIYWTPSTGAHEVHGAIRTTWAALGWERSVLGYPTSDQQSLGGGASVQSFQHGYMSLSSAGATMVHVS